MTARTTPRKTGWTWLVGAVKWHYFGTDGRSLCGRWLHLGSDAVLEDDNHDSADNCAACRKKRLAIEGSKT